MEAAPALMLDDDTRKNDERLQCRSTMSVALAAAKAATDLADGQKLSVTNFSFCAGELHYDQRENCHYSQRTTRPTSS
jgi:enolase